MTIDLNNWSLGQAESLHEVYQLKSNKLLAEILSGNKEGYNFMIVSMSIYNILEANRSFEYAQIDPMISVDHLRHMGRCGTIEVYLDLSMRPDSMKLTWNKKLIRDKKIYSVISGIEPLVVKEITVCGL